MHGKNIPEIFVVVSAAVVALVFGLLVYLGSAVRSSGGSGDSPSVDTVIKPVVSAESYGHELAKAKQEIAQVLEHRVTVADVGVLSSARDAILALVVPASERETHFQLVVKLTRLLEAVSNSTSPASTRKSTSTTSIDKLQSDLKLVLGSTGSGQ